MSEPEEVLLDALHDTNQVLQQIKRDIQGSVVNPLLLQLAGDWFDRVARIGKTVVDGDLSRKLHERVGVQAQDLASRLTALLAAVVEASPLPAAQKLALWESRFDGLRRVADGLAPSRMLGGATADFTAALQVAAAREDAVAEGVAWDDDSSESPDDVESPLLFPSYGNGLVS
jgi:hypothetical protein